MWLLAADATDDEILARCRNWIELVAAGRLTEAVDALLVPDAADESQRWTPASLESYIANYGSWDARKDGSRWRITSLESVEPRPDRPDEEGIADVVRQQADQRSGSAIVDVPLNGYWSDLTAEWEFRPVEGGTALYLYDLHVL